MSEYITEQDKQSFRCFSLFNQERCNQCSSDYIQPADKLGPYSGFVCLFVYYFYSCLPVFVIGRLYIHVSVSDFSCFFFILQMFYLYTCI